MTIMTQGNSEGTRRCDGTCHNAKHDRCTCICGGRYHGKGKQAQECLTRDWLGDDWRQKQAEVEAAGGSFVAVIQQALVGAQSRENRAAASKDAGEPTRQGRLPIDGGLS